MSWSLKKQWTGIYARNRQQVGSQGKKQTMCVNVDTFKICWRLGLRNLKDAIKLLFVSRDDILDVGRHVCKA